MKRRLLAVLCFASMSLFANLAVAQTYPDRPVRIVVPFAAGGGSDVVGRAIALKLAEKLGQPFVVENRTGAGGSLGATQVARATPDGYTLLLGSSSEIAQYPNVASNVPYDFAARLRADRIDRDRAAGADRHREPAGQECAGASGLRPPESRQAELRLGRPRLDDASGGRAVQFDDRHADDARALSRQRAGGDRPDRRHVANGDPDHVRGAAACRRRQAQAAGGLHGASGPPRCRTCRPSRRAAFQAMPPVCGPASLPPPEPLRRSSPGSAPRSPKRSRHPT